MQDFTKLKVWQKAHRLAIDLNSPDALVTASRGPSTTRRRPLALSSTVWQYEVLRNSPVPSRGYSLLHTDLQSH